MDVLKSIGGSKSLFNDDISANEELLTSNSEGKLISGNWRSWLDRPSSYSRDN